jgi:flotillin
MLEMVVDKLPDVARAIGEPLSQTEKIILFGEGAATGLTRDVTGSMMQTFEAMKSSVGLDIPNMLKTVATGGLVGRSLEEKNGE